jgi:hypothetical protein
MNMANLCHPHEMTDLVDRFQNWRGFACPYCRIAELEAALRDIKNATGETAKCSLTNQGMDQSPVPYGFELRGIQMSVPVWINGLAYLPAVEHEALAADLARYREVHAIACNHLETFRSRATALEADRDQISLSLDLARADRDKWFNRAREMEAALREAMEWDWLTDAELIPIDVRARLEGLTSVETLVDLKDPHNAHHPDRLKGPGLTAPETTCAYCKDGQCVCGSESTGSVPETSVKHVCVFAHDEPCEKEARSYTVVFKDRTRADKWLCDEAAGEVSSAHSVSDVIPNFESKIKDEGPSKGVSSHEKL